MVVSYRRFGTTHRSYLPRIMQSFLDCLALENGATRLNRNSVRNYHSTLHRVPRERRSNSHRDRCLKSHTFHDPPPPTHTKKSSAIKLWEPVSCKNCVWSSSHEVFDGRTPVFASLSVVQKQNFRPYQGKWLPLLWPKKSWRDVHLGVTTLQSVTRRIFYLFIFFYYYIIEGVSPSLNIFIISTL
jgi:hypothetical protein